MSLAENIISVIRSYEEELSSFVRNVRACKGGASQTPELLASLDKVFSSDKQLQESFKTGRHNDLFE